MSGNVDYKTGIFYRKLQRIYHDAGDIRPILKDYWICLISPKLSPKILTLIKTQFQYTSDDLRHLKRMYKTTDTSGNHLLNIIIAPLEFNDNINSYDSIHATINEKLIDEKFVLEKKQIPMNKPLDKNINDEWSKQYWPIVWKGNPMIQDMNELSKTINMSETYAHIDKLVQLSKENEQTCKYENPTIVIFVDPRTNETKSITYDQRTSHNPIKHPVVDAINEISSNELKRRQVEQIHDRNEKNYLCLNYHVYMTHEPCVMCAMALLHSRISRLVYIKPSLKTGGIGKTSGHHEMIHISCELNWKYEAFQYIDEEVFKQIKDIDENINV